MNIPLAPSLAPALEESCLLSALSSLRTQRMGVCVTCPHAPQLTEQSFQDMDEINTWLDGKVGPGTLAHPHKINESNWRLSEYWYDHHKGINNDTCKDVQERLDRQASDLGSASACMGMEEQKKKGCSTEEV